MADSNLEVFSVPALQISNLKELLELCKLAELDLRLVREFPFTDGCVVEAGEILIWRPGKSGRGMDIIKLGDSAGYDMDDLLSLVALARFHPGVPKIGSPVICLGSTVVVKGHAVSFYTTGKGLQVSLRSVGDSWDTPCRYVVKRLVKNDASQP